MGVFAVPIKVRNWQNQFLPPGERGQEITCDALVDTGAVQLALPMELVERLRLKEVGTIKAFTADGGRHEFRLFGIAEIEVKGRSCRSEVIELPHGSRALLGAVPLEQMDRHVSPLKKELVPNPESPEGPLVPMCSAWASGANAIPAFPCRATISPQRGSRCRVQPSSTSEHPPPASRGYRCS